MNALELYLVENNINLVYAMDRLHDAAIISDNAITPADVADCNCPAAIKLLTEHPSL